MMLAGRVGCLASRRRRWLPASGGKPATVPVISDSGGPLRPGVKTGAAGAGYQPARRQRLLRPVSQKLAIQPGSSERRDLHCMRPAADAAGFGEPEAAQIKMSRARIEERRPGCLILSGNSDVGFVYRAESGSWLEIELN